ncbi:MAG: GldG family protein [Armatimonadetes bacterium]|nr:GldG family protein [Armatimonadota bacterium]
MSEESKRPDTQDKRRPMADPRLEEVRAQSDAVTVAAMYAGWAAALAYVVLLFWMAVSGKFGLGPKIILGVAVVLTLFWLKYHWTTLRAAAGGRSARVGANSLIFALFILGIVVMVNIIAARRLVNVRHDFTENKLFSLSDQTREVVRSLDKEVGLIAFVSPSGNRELQDRLREYEMLSPKLTLKIYDPMTNPDKVKEYKVTSPNTIIVTSGDRQEKVVGGDEEQLTSTILAVTSGEKLKIYFLTGHGENSIESSDQRSMRTFKANLENQQYECKPRAAGRRCPVSCSGPRP